MRKPFIAGNWKMNKLAGEAADFASAFLEEIEKSSIDLEKVDVGLFVPYIHLQSLNEKFAGSGIRIGAQNVHYLDSGAYTGEVSAAMLKDIGIVNTIIGHSERRQYYGETDGSCAKKVKTALSYGIAPVLCVGESLDDREAGIYKEVVKNMLLGSLDGIEKDEIVKVVIAYEPVWAIGTGRTATADQAEEIAAWIRSALAEKYDQDAADQVRIQYGGSVKPSNVQEIMSKENIDGALVGGASLKPEDFIKLAAFDSSVLK